MLQNGMEEWWCDWDGGVNRVQKRSDMSIASVHCQFIAIINALLIICEDGCLMFFYPELFNSIAKQGMGKAKQDLQSFKAVTVKL